MSQIKTLINHDINSFKNSVFVILSILVLGAILLTYSNHFNNSFHFDDSHTILNNLFIKDLKNIPLFFKDGRTVGSLPGNQSYRPYLATENAIDYHLAGGLNSKPFHIHIFI